MKKKGKKRGPEITVLMTVYNGEKFLMETIESILKQTFKDFEFIIVNDGSTDNTKKIINKFKKRDGRIIYLETKKNKGFFNLHNVINKGLRIAKGRYIARIDADDLAYPTRLEKQYKYLEKNKDIFMIGSSFDVIDLHGKKIETIRKKSFPSLFYKVHIAFSNSFCHSSIMFRNEHLKYPTENEHLFYFDLLTKGKKIKNISDVLVKYRINPEGMMSKYSNLENNRYKDLYLKSIHPSPSKKQPSQKTIQKNKKKFEHLIRWK